MPWVVRALKSPPEPSLVAMEIESIIINGVRIYFEWSTDTVNLLNLGVLDCLLQITRLKAL